MALKDRSQCLFCGTFIAPGEVWCDNCTDDLAAAPKITLDPIPVVGVEVNGEYMTVSEFETRKAADPSYGEPRPGETIPPPPKDLKI